MPGRSLSIALIGNEKENVSIQDLPPQAEKECVRDSPMAKTVPVIGINPAELPWIRKMVGLLRHPDPVVQELTRQALLYLEAAATSEFAADSDQLDRAVNQK
jgi:hypothetical protein